MWVVSHSPGGDTVDLFLNCNHLRHATPYLATGESKMIMGTNLCLKYSSGHIHGNGHIHESLDLQ